MSVRHAINSTLFLLIYLAISTGVLCFAEKTAGIVTYSQTLLFVLFFWIGIAQIRLNGLLHLYSIFLFLFFLFLLGIPFFDWLGIININDVYLFRYVKLSNNTYIKVYIYSTFFLLFTFLGVLLGHKREDRVKKVKEVNFSPYLFVVGIIFFCLAFPGVITKYYIQLPIVFEKGYEAVYDGTLQKVSYPFICHGAGTLLGIGYCIILSSKPNRKHFLIFTIIFLLSQVINALKGQRSVLMFPAIFAVWFYFKFYTENVSKKIVLVIALGVIVFSQFILLFRSEKQYMADKPIIEKYISSFFVGQGASFFVFPYMIHYDLKNDGYPYLLAPLNIMSWGKTQDMERLQYNFVGDRLMYRMLPESYKAGAGVGSSILAVFHDLPYIIAIVLCLLFGFLIARFEHLLKGSRTLLVFSYFIFFSIIASPRYELLNSFYDMVILGIIFIVINLIYCNIFKVKSVENYTITTIN
jgi:oligosaccharide repeat unit polymerase